jgi:hypothetical protein
MNELEPMSTEMSVPLPPSKGSPSILPVKSMITRSFSAALAFFFLSV